MVTKDQLSRGVQIACVPDHANGRSDTCIEYGFVTSVADEFAFCRYWYPGSKTLRTKANSEATYFRNLVLFTSVPKEQVEQALKDYC